MHYAFRFVLAVLAVWRLTHLLAKEDGPWQVIERVRRIFPGELFTCFYCLSVWVAVPFVWFTGGSPFEKLVTWWAISGAAVLLEKITDKSVDIEIREDPPKDNEYELLRETAGRLVINQKDIDAGLALEIEYSGGRRTVTVTGRVSGRSYLFSGLDRLRAVDPRDAVTILRDGRFRMKRVILPKQERN